MWSEKLTTEKISELLSDEDSNNVKLLYNYLFSEVVNEIERQKDNHFKDFFDSLTSYTPSITTLAVEIDDLRRENRRLQEKLENLEDILFHMQYASPGPSSYFTGPPPFPTM